MAKQKIEKYGYKWDAELTDLEIEMGCIRHNVGKGLSFHYEQMRRLLWPRLDTHRWHELCRDEICKNKVTVLMGPKSSAKTHEAAWYGLCKWFSDPENTCILVSSTDIRGLKLRIWGEITGLWQEALERFDFLPGHVLDSRIAITFESLIDGDLDDRSVRDMRKAIVGIPCVQGGKFVGIGKYCGIKQKNVLLIADELQFMQASFLSAMSNLDGNENFQAIMLGNPNDIVDPLGRAAEPKDGWGQHMEPDKTSTWDTRFMGGRCVNLIGTDSPNMDYPANQPTRFKYLISRDKIESTASFFDRNSFEFYSQCIGCMKIGQMARRVLTREMCLKFKAMDDVVWASTGTTKIGALDAAYGGDRCVGGHIEFGTEVGGKTVIYIHPPQVVPVRQGPNMAPEDSIAEWVKVYCERNSISPENFFHDSTGRGSLGTALARIWSAQCNPVEFGGAPTERPVSLDMFIYDDKTRQRRLRTCREHYIKFVTELWFSVRYAIEAGQIRNLPEEVMEEGCMREWDKKNDKIELETKLDMKERVGRSPDLMDWLSICVEGARRRGFQISKLSNAESESRSLEWLKKLSVEQHQQEREKQLDYEAA